MEAIPSSQSRSPAASADAPPRRDGPRSPQRTRRWRAVSARWPPLMPHPTVNLFRCQAGAAPRLPAPRRLRQGPQPPRHHVPAPQHHGSPGPQRRLRECPHDGIPDPLHVPPRPKRSRSPAPRRKPRWLNTTPACRRRRRPRTPPAPRTGPARPPPPAAAPPASAPPPAPPAPAPSSPAPPRRGAGAPGAAQRAPFPQRLVATRPIRVSAAPWRTSTGSTRLQMPATQWASLQPRPLQEAPGVGASPRP